MTAGRREPATLATRRLASGRLASASVRPGRAAKAPRRQLRTRQAHAAPLKFAERWLSTRELRCCSNVAHSSVFAIDVIASGIEKQWSRVWGEAPQACAARFVHDSLPSDCAPHTRPSEATSLLPNVLFDHCEQCTLFFSLSLSWRAVRAIL